MNFKTQILGLVIFVLLLIALFYFFNTKEISKNKAIQIAEKFIVENGYTEHPADKLKIEYELFDQYMNIDSILYFRHNTLYKNAYYTSQDEENWHIGFLSSKVDLSKIDDEKFSHELVGRIVIVSKDGNQVKIEHKDPIFSMFDKLDR